VSSPRSSLKLSIDCPSAAGQQPAIIAPYGDTAIYRASDNKLLDRNFLPGSKTCVVARFRSIGENLGTSGRAAEATCGSKRKDAGSQN
jgi:hypothetical protein